MAEAIIEKQKCAKCGVNVRENTQFCYNCGESVVKPPELSDDVTAGGTEEAVPELTEPVAADTQKGDDKLARAAEERKKARVERRRPRDYTWEPVDGSPVMLLVFTVGIVFIVLVIVLLGVWWK